jgi:hypothetical protein
VFGGVALDRRERASRVVRVDRHDRHAHLFRSSLDPVGMKEAQRQMANMMKTE